MENRRKDELLSSWRAWSNKRKLTDATTEHTLYIVCGRRKHVFKAYSGSDIKVELREWLELVKELGFKAVDNPEVVLGDGGVTLKDASDAVKPPPV